jgi:hypothetical protein
MSYDSASDARGLRRFLSTLLALPLLFTGGAPTPSSADAIARTRLSGVPPTQVAGMFGFRVGEERRWTVESDAFTFAPGEHVLWTMRLEAINGKSPSAVAHFRLTHEARVFSRRHNILDPDEMDVTRTTTELWANEQGFPLRVLHRDHRSGTIGRRGHLDIRAQFGGLHVWDAGAIGYRSYLLAIPGADAVDLAVPEGVFLSPHLNPGLLTLPFLVLSERNPGSRFVAFDPTPLVDPPPTTPAPADASISPGASSWSMRHPPTPAQLAARCLRRTRLAIGPLEQIDLGGVTTTAHRVDVSTAGDAWIEPDGTVARVLIMLRRTNARVRLLRPSEY